MVFCYHKDKTKKSSSWLVSSIIFFAPLTFMFSHISLHPVVALVSLMTFEYANIKPSAPVMKIGDMVRG